MFPPAIFVHCGTRLSRKEPARKPVKRMLRSLTSGLVFALALVAAGQTAQISPAPTLPVPAMPAPTWPDLPAATLQTAPADVGVQALLAFRDTDVKFRLADLMDVLRDRRHEGWVLAAYPDPKTGGPLIGAGFSLDLPEREHPQTDPLNPHPFVEPSSAQLWAAAGLDPARLQQILADYEARLADWKMKRFRRHIGELEPQITEDDASALLRIAAIQAIVNARAWCRNFDDLSASQQMAVSQLVYQMGVNLGEFTNFLSLMNQSDAPAGEADWRAVQQSLEQSQWARLYRVRAVAVIAMLDPRYSESPSFAERKIAAVLRPAHRRRYHATTLETASYHRRTRQSARHHAAARSRRKV